MLSFVQEIKAVKPQEVKAVIQQAEETTQALKEQVAVVDMLITNDRWLKAHQVPEKLKEMDAGKKVLQSIAATQPADKSVEFVGSLGVVELGARANATTFPKPFELLDGLRKKFGDDVASAVVSIGITELKKLLSEHEIAAYSSVSQTGSRVSKIKPTTAGEQGAP